MDLSPLDRFQDKTTFLDNLEKRVFETEVECHGCSQVIVHCFLDVLDLDNNDLIRAASPFAAGMSLTGHNCGALIGSLMVLGLVFGREEVHQGMPGLLKGIKPMRRLVRYFKERAGAVDCRAITGADLAKPDQAEAYFQAGGLDKCAGLMADSARFAADIIWDRRQAQKTA